MQHQQQEEEPAATARPRLRLRLGRPRSVDPRAAERHNAKGKEHHTAGRWGLLLLPPPRCRPLPACLHLDPARLGRLLEGGGVQIAPRCCAPLLLLLLLLLLQAQQGVRGVQQGHRAGPRQPGVLQQLRHGLPQDLQVIAAWPPAPLQHGPPCR
jgi:hypothetical protein